ncbi:MAG TPA: hypothetical protein H9875_06880 [Candidatus Levilactobacillus faecigallinarum]|uniref:Uncharacterized protein n=1 Tax=Candidatus Levilactobacillus faecigallinarum TaxID=2838638 RepID=A0A9D1QUQ4_9LACO|nr:hypothetical protein [Candidatus Levilactobacillus faecigallinarum]
MTNQQTVTIAIATLQRLDENLRGMESVLLSQAAESADQKTLDGILKQAAAANEASEDLKQQLKQLQHHTRTIPMYGNLIVH